MAKISFVKQLLFGSTGTASKFGQPGSYNTTKTNTKDPATIQALSAFLSGLESIVPSGTYKVAIEDLNSLLLLSFYQLAYVQQAGVCEWSTDVTYYIGSIVNISGTIYKSLTNNNTGNNPASSAANWSLVSGDAPGTLKEFAGPAANIPAGFLVCDGAAVSRTTYANLYAAIGTAWGAGDESTTFNLPPGGLVSVGYKSTDSDFNAVGKTGGEKTHALTAAELAAHDHFLVKNASTNAALSASNYIAKDSTVGGDDATKLVGQTNVPDIGKSGIAGSGTPMNIMQPYGVVLKIIKY